MIQECHWFKSQVLQGNICATHLGHAVTPQSHTSDRHYRVKGKQQGGTDTQEKSKAQGLIQKERALLISPILPEISS